MFKIVPNPTFTCDVPLSRPDEARPVTIKITYRHKTRRELADYQARAMQVALAADETGAEASYAAYVGEVIDGWSGVGDAEGRPVPYTGEALAQLLNQFPAAGAEIVRKYTLQLSHARAGN